MPFPLHLFNPQSFPRLTPRRVSLVRFVRAIDGFAAEDASDPDDRGFNLDATFANAHGSAFGISGPDGATPAQQCRIRVMRDRLEPAVNLFPEIVNAALVTQVSPAAGAAINPNAPGNDTIVVRAAIAPATATSTTLRLHAGAAAGPVVGECAIRVCPILPIPVKGHLVTINGVAPSSVEQTFIDLVFNANKILVPAGVKLTLEPGILPDDVPGLTTANTVTLFNTGRFDRELAIVMRNNAQPGVLNVYIVGHIDNIRADGTTATDNVNGVGISSDFANRNRPSGTYVGAQVGFLMRDPGDLERFAQTFVHELGHVLTLEHYNNLNGAAVLQHHWSERNIMFNFAFVNSVAPVDQIGYGRSIVPVNGVPRDLANAGMFFGIKQLPNIFQSQQSEIMRTAVNNGTFLIV